jgi:hypothetical protein
VGAVVVRGLRRQLLGLEQPPKVSADRRDVLNTERRFGVSGKQ